MGEFELEDEMETAGGKRKMWKTAVRWVIHGLIWVWVAYRGEGEWPDGDQFSKAVKVRSGVERLVLGKFGLFWTVSGFSF